MNVLIVRLGALGDIVHTIPAAAALRAALPDARIDWVVDARHRAIVDLVTAVDRVIAIEGRTLRAWTAALARLRQIRYDVALDFQGLMKSAVLARASGATRVAGFSIWHLREKSARPFYSETGRSGNPPPEHEHVVHKNLRLLEVVGVHDVRVEFPLARVESATAEEVIRPLRGEPLALINPGGAWPNKRWPPQRYGEVASFLREVCRIQPVVLWGPGERELAQAVVDASGGTAQLAPPTTITDVVALSRAASLMVSGDTGPLHIAAAVGAPVLGVFGPTDPKRNGPWSPQDVVVSRFESCGCHYQRECRQESWCLEAVTTAEVCAAVQQRLAACSRTPDPRDG